MYHLASEIVSLFCYLNCSILYLGIMQIYDHVSFYTFACCPRVVAVMCECGMNVVGLQYLAQRHFSGLKIEFSQ